MLLYIRADVHACVIVHLPTVVGVEVRENINTVCASTRINIFERRPILTYTYESMHV